MREIERVVERILSIMAWAFLGLVIIGSIVSVLSSCNTLRKTDKEQQYHKVETFSADSVQVRNHIFETINSKINIDSIFSNSQFTIEIFDTEKEGAPLAKRTTISTNVGQVIGYTETTADKTDSIAINTVITHSNIEEVSNIHTKTKTTVETNYLAYMIGVVFVLYAIIIWYAGYGKWGSLFKRILRLFS